MQDPALWSHIKAHDFWPEDPAHTGKGAEVQSSIAARLAEDENWTADYINGAIEEYRRFVYLSRISSYHLTPSAVIDQVWHAHMVDTREYVDGFCMRLFGGILHHEPATGPEQLPRYEAQYARAGALYEQEFGREPPENVWIYRDAQTVAANTRQARRATWLSILAGFAIAGIGYAAFGWIIFAIFLGYVTQMIVSLALSPKVPGPSFKSSEDSGTGGCSGCGD